MRQQLLAHELVERLAEQQRDVQDVTPHRAVRGITELVLVKWKYTESLRRWSAEPGEDKVRAGRSYRAVQACQIVVQEGRIDAGAVSASSAAAATGLTEEVRDRCT